jgi:O-antigen/teichoic acid export membrane protein
MKVGPAFLQTFASQIVQSAATIASGVLIARGLGPAGQGRYALLAAAVGLLSTIAAAGQFEGHVLTSAGGRSVGRVLLARSVLQALGAIVLLGVVQALWRRPLALAGEDVVAGVFVLVLFCEVLALLFRGINLGQHQVTAYNVATLIQRVCFLGAVALLAVTRGLSLEGVLFGWLGAVIANVVVTGVWIWRRSGALSLSWARVREGWGGSLTRGFRALLTISFTLLLTRADVYMLGPMLGVLAVGQISIASAFAEYLWYVPSILSSVLFAAVAESRGPHTIDKICRASRTTIAVLVPVGLGLGLVVRELVPLIYGRAYALAGTLVLILLPGMLAICLHLVIDSYFAGTGFPPISYLAAAGAVVLKVALNLVVVPSLGIEGAAAATSIAYVSLLLIKVIAFRRNTHVSLGRLFSPTWTDLAYNLAVIRSWVQRFGRAPADVRG